MTTYLILIDFMLSLNTAPRASNENKPIVG